MSGELRFRNINMNEPVSVTLPAHVWLGFIFTYAGANWTDICTSRISGEVQKQLLDPVYLKEQEAAAQHQADLQMAAFHHFTGQPQDFPPNMTDGIPPQPGDE